MHWLMKVISRRSKTISDQDNNEARKPFRAYGRKAKISDRAINRVRSTDGRDFCSGVYASYTKSRSADPRTTIQATFNASDIPRSFFYYD